MRQQDTRWSVETGKTGCPFGVGKFDLGSDAGCCGEAWQELGNNRTAWRIEQGVNLSIQGENTRPVSHNGVLQPPTTTALWQCPKPTVLLFVILESTCFRHVDSLPGIQRRSANISIPLKLWRRLRWSARCVWTYGRTRRLDDGMAGGIWHRGISWRAAVVGRAGCQLWTHQDQGV